MKKNFQDFLKEKGLSSVQLCNLACLPYHTAKSVITGRDTNPSLVTRYRLFLVTGSEYCDILPLDVANYEEQKKKNVIWQQAEEVSKWLVERWRNQGILPQGKEALSPNANDPSQNLPYYLSQMYPKVSKADILESIQNVLLQGGRQMKEADVEKLRVSVVIFLGNLEMLLSANANDFNQAKRLLTGELAQVANLLNIVMNPDPHAALRQQIMQTKIFKTL